MDFFKTSAKLYCNFYLFTLITKVFCLDFSERQVPEHLLSAIVQKERGDQEQRSFLYATNQKKFLLLPLTRLMVTRLAGEGHG